MANDTAADETILLLPYKLVLYSATHTLATDMVKEMDVVSVKELPGHGSLATTRKYLHPDTSAAAEAVTKRNRRKSGWQSVKKIDSA